MLAVGTGTWPSLVRALVWGTREPGFKSPRPDTNRTQRSNVGTERYGAVMTTRTRNIRTWTDEQLAEAIAVSTSWRGVMRELGLGVTSAGPIHTVRRVAQRLGLDTSHFRGKRAWSDAQLRRAVMDSRSWAEALTSLGLAPASGDGKIRVKAHAIRVKTSTHDTKGGWHCSVGRRPYSPGNTERVIPYDPDVIDLFFIVDGDMTMYLVPSRAFAGRVRILLRAYKKYIVGNAAGLLETAQHAA